MISLRYSHLADQDLEQIYLHGALRFGVAQADRYDAELRRAAEMIVAFPEIGAQHTLDGGNLLRRYGCGRHAIFYRRDESGILIVRSLHGGMDFQRRLPPASETP